MVEKGPTNKRKPKKRNVKVKDQPIKEIGKCDMKQDAFGQQQLYEFQESSVAVPLRKSRKTR